MKRYGLKVELDPAAERELGKLDRQDARRILAFLFERVAKLDDTLVASVKPSRAASSGTSGSIAWVTTG